MEENIIKSADAYTDKQREEHIAIAQDMAKLLIPLLQQNHMGAYYGPSAKSKKGSSVDQKRAQLVLPEVLIQALPTDGYLSNPVLKTAWEQGMDVPFFSLRLN